MLPSASMVSSGGCEGEHNLLSAPQSGGLRLNKISFENVCSAHFQEHKLRRAPEKQ